MHLIYRKTLDAEMSIFLSRFKTKLRKKRYRNDLKFSDRYAWTNSADPDQTAPIAIPSASFGLITLW